MSNSKTQSSTLGFSSNRDNASAHRAIFGGSELSTSKYLQNADQSSVSRSSFYLDREMSETLMMRSQAYTKIECPHCSRKFCRKAAERHVPLCDKIHNKPKALFRNREKQFLPELNEKPAEGKSHRTYSVKPKATYLIEEPDNPNLPARRNHNQSFSSNTYIFVNHQSNVECESGNIAQSKPVKISIRTERDRRSVSGNYVHQAGILTMHQCS
mmetsp:Transcript_9781/g.10987  ORF Transcript_9781/g.10987 Transcript_9781/m.10987 type:complete len:213 (-) Transcript_9781:94-732(-)